MLRSAVRRAADLGAAGVVVALHSYTGSDLNNNTGDDDGFRAAVRFVADEARAAGVPEVILRMRGRFSGGGAWRTDGAGVNGFSADKTLPEAIAFVQSVGRSNLKLGLSLSNLVAAGAEADTVARQLTAAKAHAPLGMIFFAASEDNPFADARMNEVFSTLNARVSEASAAAAARPPAHAAGAQVGGRRCTGDAGCGAGDERPGVSRGEGAAGGAVKARSRHVYPSEPSCAFVGPRHCTPHDRRNKRRAICSSVWR